MRRTGAGLDDRPAIVLSCLLVFTVLVYVYPLRFLAQAMSGEARPAAGTR